MAVTIAQLDIEIKSTGDKSIAAFTKLANKLNTLSAHIEKTASSMRKMSGDMKKMGKDTEKAGASAEKGAKGLGSFASSILRIMKYRAIRAVLKTITQGFREGVQNIALYSAAINEMDASKANNVMSAYASMGAQIKNSLGAAVMPMLANLLPVIQKVADMFMDAAEAVAKFFATLNGQTTYTAANRDYWVDYAKGLQKSTGAAKELKRTILGFDEINALNSQSSGGSGSSTPNYKDMFVEKTNDWFGLKDTFEQVLMIVSQIGAAMLAWKLSASLINILDKLGVVGGILKAAIGIVLVVKGVEMSWNAGEALASGNLTEAITNGVGGILSTALGGAMLGSFFGAGGTAIGFAIGVGVSLVTTVISFIVNSDASRAEANKRFAEMLATYGLQVTDVSAEKTKANLNVAINMTTGIESIKTNMNNAIAELDVASKLLAEIFRYDKKKNLTAEQILDVKTKIELLNSMNLDGIRVEWDDVTQSIIANEAAIYANIDALKEEIRYEAYKSIAIEALTQEIKARARLKEAQEEQLALDQAIFASGRIATEEQQEAYDNLSAEIAELKKNIKTFGTEYDEAFGGMLSATGNVSDALDDLGDYASEAAKRVKNAFEPSRLFDAPTFVKTVESAFRNITLPSMSWSATGNGNIKAAFKASGGFVPSGDLFVAGEAGAELIMAAPNGSEVVNMAQFESAMMNAVSMAGGNGGDWTIVVQDGNGAERSRQVITAAERANRRDGRTIIPVGVY